MMFVPREQELLHKQIALLTAVATMAIGVVTLFKFDYGQAGRLQFFADVKWIPVIHSNYTIGIDGMTISEVRGHGRQKGHKEVYRGMEYQVDLLPKVKVEMVVPDSRADEVVKTVVASARTGKIGDGKVFILPIEEVVRLSDIVRGPEGIS